MFMFKFFVLKDGQHKQDTVKPPWPPMRISMKDIKANSILVTFFDVVFYWRHSLASVTSYE